MDRKLIFFDIDGTLLAGGYAGYVPESTKLALRKLKEAGLDYDVVQGYINRNIDEAIAECERLGIHGKQTTPYLLDKIQKLTGGDSLKANIQLVYNNARLGARIAAELSK